MAVSTSAPMAYAPVMRVILWLQTKRIATLKIAECQNRHTVHQVSVKRKLKSYHKTENKLIELENKGCKFCCILSLKIMRFLVAVSENALLRK